MKVGIIGTGTMGKNHARIYSELKGVEDIYVFDLNKDHAKEMRKMGYIVCDSVNELLDFVDAVSICVPTNHHFDIAKVAIENNVHCLIEKPVTLSFEEGNELLNFFDNTDLIVGVGHIERFNPIVDEITKLIEKPFLVEIKRHNPSSSRITDGSVIEDLMIHDIDIVFNVLFDTNNYKIHSGGTVDYCKSMVSFNDSIATISASRRACKKIRNIYIEDENFTIEGDFMTQEIYTYWKPEKYGVEKEKYTQENIIEKIMVNKVEPLKVELKTFIDCVKRNKHFPVTLEQAINNLKICEEIRKGIA
jgi:predicted dehydrogenase